MGEQPNNVPKPGAAGPSARPPQSGPAGPIGPTPPADALGGGPEPVEPARPLSLGDLRLYAEQIGLELPSGMGADDLIELVRQRRQLIDSLPLEVLAEVASWAHLSVKPPLDKTDLARQISQMRHTRFAGLSTEGLRAMAALRGCAIEPDDDRDALRRKIKAREGFFHKLRRKVRRGIGGFISGVFGEGEDRSLPEEQRSLSLKERIENAGFVRGVTGSLRGAADDYIRQKLDEIETRIDRKLEDIDRRLAEWRDREIANRLKIIRITLLASIIVALLSLAYTYARAKFPTLLP